jgi:hypothetical protein
LGPLFARASTLASYEDDSSLKAIAATLAVITAAMVLVAVLTELNMTTPVRAPSMKMLALHCPQSLKK